MFFGRLGSLWYMKYVVVLVVGVLFVGFIDDNSLWAHIRNKKRINELGEEIQKYRETYEHDQAQIYELQHNPKAIEKIARERYFMNAEDEDVFVLSEDSQEATANSENDETAE